MRMLARAAVLIAVAGALKREAQVEGNEAGDAHVEGNDASVDDGSSSPKKSDLPRYVVQAAREDGCGGSVPGYLLFGQGLLWSDGQRTHAKGMEDCRKQCDQVPKCVGFTARQPRDGDGKLQCSQYLGLAKTFDPRGKSYNKCTKGLRCADSSSYPGFQFSHKGSWTGGVKDTATDLEGCSKACGQDRSCAGFTHRFNKAGMGECYRYKNAANLAGPKRDMRANTYSKCALAEQPAAGGAPDLPLIMATVPETAGCNDGYVASSKGWFWPGYAAKDLVADQQACASACTSAQTCVSFVYQPSRSHKMCYMYNGLTNTFSPSAVAFLKCPHNSDCDAPAYKAARDSYNFRGHFKFSHQGHFLGGQSFADVTLEGCNVICDISPSCAALSWQAEDSICTIHELKASLAPPLPVDGAEGYSKCTAPQGHAAIELMNQEPQP